VINIQIANLQNDLNELRLEKYQIEGRAAELASTVASRGTQIELLNNQLLSLQVCSLLLDWVLSPGREQQS
jgi:hypothetical protein